MAILSIERDWGPGVQIVRIVSNDTLAAMITPGYLTSQAAVILDLNKGAFQWDANDYVLISYNGGKGFFTYNGTTLAFVEAGIVPYQQRVTSAQILGMNAAPVRLLPDLPVTMAYVLNRIWCTYDFVAAAYAAGGAISLRWGSTTNLASSTLAAATFNGFVADNAFDLTPDGTDTIANIAGKGIFLSNDTAAFTTGDGILTVNLNYNIVTI
jgi:hypothetical protein